MKEISLKRNRILDSLQAKTQRQILNFCLSDVVLTATFCLGGWRPKERVVLWRNLFFFFVRLETKHELWNIASPSIHYKINKSHQDSMHKSAWFGVLISLTSVRRMHDGVPDVVFLMPVTLLCADWWLRFQSRNDRKGVITPNVCAKYTLHLRGCYFGLMECPAFFEKGAINRLNAHGRWITVCYSF